MQAGSSLFPDYTQKNYIIYSILHIEINIFFLKFSQWL